ncbi:capsule assembly Wzi family protein, partial [Amylibacter sp.]|nr:capsule assembly Wzi family protein [Amylibacter sp.]
TAFVSNESIGFYNNISPQNKSNINFNLKYSKNNLSSQLSFNYDNGDELSFDNSFANYRIGIADINIGKINRIWSFSKKSSLILSSNSRPLEAISIKLANRFNSKWLSSTSKWSFEIINGPTENSLNNKSSMLSGARVIFSPSEKLNFELLKTSQWGDSGDKLYSTNIDALLFANTNEGLLTDINKMAGFGFSYSVPLETNTYRFYSQAIGEDEAGSLPSCYSWMSGLELSTLATFYPTTVTIEAIDTRTRTSKNGYCGPNTMYNNGIYKYINHDKTLGVPIDSEGTSLEIFGQSQVNMNLGINYSTKFIVVNDKNFPMHRLSSKRSTGTVTVLGIDWGKNGVNLGGNISFQNIVLDKANISNSTSFSIFTSFKF